MPERSKDASSKDASIVTRWNMMRLRDKYMTLTEAAAQLRVNRITVRRWIKAGKLPAEEIGGVVLIERKHIERVEAAAQEAQERVLAQSAEEEK